jgi:hypothetical protein
MGIAGSVMIAFSRGKITEFFGEYQLNAEASEPDIYCEFWTLPRSAIVYIKIQLKFPVLVANDGTEVV